MRDRGRNRAVPAAEVKHFNRMNTVFELSEDLPRACEKLREEKVDNHGYVTSRRA